MDDGRVWIRAIKWGYIFRKDTMKLKFNADAFLRDSRRQISPTEKTSEVMLTILNSLTPDLKFTLECQDDFKDKHIPTLDFSLQLSRNTEGTHRNTFMFFQKPTSNPYTIMENSTIGWQDNFNTLKQEVCRRLDKMSPDQRNEESIEVLDAFNEKMMLSGYDLEKNERNYYCRDWSNFEKTHKSI